MVSLTKPSVPKGQQIILDSDRRIAPPKSHNLIWPFRVMRTFNGFMSLCMIPLRWRNKIPKSNSNSDINVHCTYMQNEHRNICHTRASRCIVHQKKFWAQNSDINIQSTYIPDKYKLPKSYCSIKIQILSSDCRIISSKKIHSEIVKYLLTHLCNHFIEHKYRKTILVVDFLLFFFCVVTISELKLLQFSCLFCG